MNLNVNEFEKLAGIVKAALEDTPNKPPSRHRKHKRYDPAYLDYSKALSTQQKRSPTAEGLKRGLGTGALGVVLGALAAKMVSDNPKVMAGGAALGGLAGAIPGFQSGRSEARSENTRINFLRRLGISRPGELEAIQQYDPNVTADVREQGAVI